MDEADRLVPEGTIVIPQRAFQLLEASKRHLLEAFRLSNTGTIQPNNNFAASGIPLTTNGLSFTAPICLIL